MSSFILAMGLLLLIPEPHVLYDVRKRIIIKVGEKSMTYTTSNKSRIKMNGIVEGKLSKERPRAG